MKHAMIGWVVLALVAGCDNTSASDPVPEVSPNQALSASPAFRAAWAGVCFERAKVYRAMATIKERGVSHSEAISRVSPLEDAQKLADLKRIGMSNYVDAVNAIYDSSDPQATVRQLNEECEKAGRD